MLGHAIPWRAAPRLPLQAMRVGLRIRPTAFGNAIGGAFVGKMQEPSGGVAALQQAERDVEIPYLNEQYNSDQASMSNSSGYMGDVVSLDGAGILRPPGVGYTQAELLAEQDAGMDDSAKVYTQRSHVVQAGDSISKILGTSDPTSIGAFMRRNDLKNSTIYPGRELVIPDGFADGDGARGQAALNADNASRVTKANTEKQAGILGFMGAADAYYAGQAQWAAVARATTPFQISGSLNLVPENRYTPANSYLGDAYREAYGGMVNTSNSWREQAGYGVRAVLLAVPGLLNDLSAAIWNGPNDIYVGGQEMMFGHATGNLDRFSGGLMRSSVGVLSVASTGSMWQQGLAANAAVTEYSIYNQAASASYRNNEVGLGLRTLDPTATSFTQSWVNSTKLEGLVQSMETNGWKGRPVDAVMMRDGTIASIDNTRVLAARQSGVKLEANVRGFDAPITDAVRQESLMVNGVVPKTWGEAAQLRINSPLQNRGIPGWSQRFPNGSIYDPITK